MKNSAMLENADPAATLLGIAIGAVVIFGVAWAMKSESSPSPSTPKPSGQKPACPTYDDLAAFANQRDYHIWYVENQPVGTWKAPKPEYANDPKARAWGAAECNFFKWFGGVWLPDAETNQQYISWSENRALSGPRLAFHPLAALMPPLG